MKLENQHFSLFKSKFSSVFLMDAVNLTGILHLAGAITVAD
jgi:hypothetical protein